VHLSEASHYVATVSEDGKVVVWNAELALIKMITSEFKRELDQVEEIEQI